jgi:anhydro-N-acetylmuramic acid kinase
MLFIGLMSGTSLDGVDAVLAQTQAQPVADALRAIRGTAHAHVPMPADLGRELLALNSPGGVDELHRAALAANALMRLYAQAVAAVMHQAGLLPAQVRALGAHGQTVRHRPREFDGTGYTLQLMNGALLAELTGIDVVCDFRSRDIAAGGEGAPLVPAFHAACFARAGQTVALVNIGGVANLSLLHSDGAVQGFDTGPGNILMNAWCMRHQGQPFDAAGAWAATGSAHEGLVQHLLADPYFHRAPPKSTGRDWLSAAWLDQRLQAFAAASALPAQDVMASLLEVTARSITHDLQAQAPNAQTLYVCGGGAFNTRLMQRLAGLLGSSVAVSSTAALGVPPDQVEALAFAWLASRCVARQPGNLAAVTGAAGPRVLGAIYPGS